MLNIKIWTWALALTSAISFLLCIVWGLVTPHALHMHGFLESVLPGFEWLTLGSFGLGLIESFFFGAYAALLFVTLHNALYRRWGAQT